MLNVLLLKAATLTFTLNFLVSLGLEITKGYALIIKMTKFIEIPFETFTVLIGDIRPI